MILSLVIMLVIIGFAIIKWRLWESHKKEAFDRTPSHIEYSKDAECKMSCRHISKQDISDVIRRGVIIFNRTNLRIRACPVFTVQGFTDSGENIRIIFQQCQGITKVVTCYDIKKDFNCDCNTTERAVTFFKNY